MQDTTRNVLIGVMVIVAVINLITCLIILVLERIRMIGVLKSLGATNWTIQKIFLRHSALITIIGILMGAGLGLLLLWIQDTTGFIKLKEDAYYMSTAAVKIVWWQIGAVCAGTSRCLLCHPDDSFRDREEGSTGKSDSIQVYICDRMIAVAIAAFNDSASPLLGMVISSSANSMMAG